MTHTYRCRYCISFQVFLCTILIWQASELELVRGHSLENSCILSVTLLLCGQHDSVHVPWKCRTTFEYHFQIGRTRALSNEPSCSGHLQSKWMQTFSHTLALCSWLGSETCTASCELYQYDGADLLHLFGLIDIPSRCTSVTRDLNYVQWCVFGDQIDCWTIWGIPYIWRE